MSACERYMYEQIRGMMHLFVKRAYKWDISMHGFIRIGFLMSEAELCFMVLVQGDGSPEGPHFLCDEKKRSRTVLINPDRNHTEAVTIVRE